MTEMASEGADLERESAAESEFSRLARARDAVVMEIAADMSAGHWGEGSHEVLAARERVKVSTVRSWASSAARMLRLADQPAMKALHALNVQRLNEVYDDAKADRDHKARVGAIAEQNKLCGLITQKVDLTASTVTAEQWATFRAAVMSELCGECRERLLKKLEEGGA